jgi:UDP-N-acetylmuramate dehydrogenase
MTLIEQIRALSGVELREQAPLSELGTFRLGGACTALVDCCEPGPLSQVMYLLAMHQETYVLIGGGSNLLFSDQGFAGWVVRYHSLEPLIAQDGTRLLVTGSTVLDDLAAFAAEAGLEGVNGCTGIPGTVGGAIVGNAGAWGEQIGDVVESVELLDPMGDVYTAEAAELEFAYRHSKLKTCDEIVLCAQLTLREGDTVALQAQRAAILEKRAEKHPDLAIDPCIGSIFKNIEPSSAAGRRQAAGYFLEQAGAKTFRVGGAQVYEKHANIIVKRAECTAQDVYDLSLKMHAAVQDQLDFSLIREVRFLGPFDGADSHKGFF